MDTNRKLCERAWEREREEEHRLGIETESTKYSEYYASRKLQRRNRQLRKFISALNNVF